MRRYPLKHIAVREVPYKLLKKEAAKRDLKIRELTEELIMKELDRQKEAVKVVTV